MRIVRVLSLAAMLALAACGDLSGDLERAKHGAIEAGQDALSAGMEQVDTRTACLLSGQSEVFCTCLSERLGDDISPEQIAALADAVRSTLSGDRADATTEASETLNAQTREALVQCSVQAGIEGAAGEGGAN